jgi:hypothetical protein
MKSILDRYLDRVLIYANKPEVESASVRQELRDHLLQKIDDLLAGGMPREEATLEALRQHGSPKIIGYKLRGPFPWVDIRSEGTARGVIAIGPRAVGIFAFGGVAVGVFAGGTFAVGIFSAGFLAVGLIWAWAFLGIGGITTAFIAIGVVAAGMGAIGLVAGGGAALGAWVPNGDPASGLFSHYTAQNVPSYLKALEPVLKDCTFFGRHAITVFLPAYLVVILALGYLKYREGKRVASIDDWLIDG